MKKLPVIYSRSHDPGTVLVRTATWSSWGHCGIVTAEGTVIEARFWKGVIETPLEEFEARSSKFEIVRTYCPRPADAIAWARSQLGKPYDTLGVLGIGLRSRKWNKDDAWFCSELVEAALEAGGRTRFRHDLFRVTPQHSWMVK